MATNIAKLQESVKTLKQLYGVVMGLGLTTALRHLVKVDEHAGTTAVLDTAAIPWVIVICVTLLPFYHGATRHMDDAYVLSPTRIRAGAVLLDYSLLFLGAASFFWLSLVVGNHSLFCWGYIATLAIDIVWALSAIFLVAAGQYAVRWLAINAFVVVFILLVKYTPLLDSAPPEWLVLVACLRTVIDYWMCWPTYFPPPEPEQALNEPEGGSAPKLQKPPGATG